MSLVDVPSDLSRIQNTAKEEVKISALHYALRKLLNFWGYKEEECPLCRPYFDLQNDKISLSPAALTPEQGKRCHGCWLAEFALSFCAHIVEKKGQRILSMGCYLEPANRHTNFVLDVTEQINERPVRRITRLEIFKTTQMNEKDRWSRWLPGFLETRAPLYLERAFETPPISGYTGSDAAFERICSWFKTCSSIHPACGNNQQIPILPTRVIDIADKNNIRLIESEGAQSHYICLSHRWMDDKKMPRCTKANISSLKQHIPWNFLTQSFQDAISFVEDFSKWFVQGYPGQDSIRYIWIDSLCIIQDSVGDWIKESSLMCSVYEGAILTVAAAAGADGCFSEAERVFKGFDVSNPQRQNPRLHLRKELPYHRIQMPEGEFNTDYSYANSLDLLTRGWVMQERLLSPRFVIFSPNEIMWECFENTDCECGRMSEWMGREALGGETAMIYNVRRDMQKFYEQQQTEDPNYLLNPKPFKVAYHTSLNDKGENRERNLRNWWRRLAETYSALHLTKESDRLPAIKGLATQFGKRTAMEDYVAGHWRAGLPFDLAWYTRDPIDTLPGQEHDQSHGVPSWSWASCAGLVQMPREPPKSLAEMIIYPELVLVSPGSLKIKCSIFTTLTDYLDDPNFPIAGTYFPDRTSASQLPLSKGMYVPITCSKPFKQWGLIHIQPVSPDKLQFRRLGLLEIGARKKGELSEKEREEITDLTLRSCFEYEAVDQEIVLV